MHSALGASMLGGRGCPQGGHQPRCSQPLQRLSCALPRNSQRPKDPCPGKHCSLGEQLDSLPKSKDLPCVREKPPLQESPASPHGCHWWGPGKASLDGIGNSQPATNTSVTITAISQVRGMTWRNKQALGHTVRLGFHSNQLQPHKRLRETQGLGPG